MREILPRLRPITHRASSIWRHLACPGSPDLESRSPISPPDEPAIQGTKVHRVGEVALKEAGDPANLLGEELTCQQTDKNGDEYDINFIVTGEMVEAVSHYTDFVFDILERHPEAMMWVEEDLTIDFPVLADGDDDRGTVKVGAHADCIIFVPGVAIWVIDYKNGVVQVDPENNGQLVTYLIGAISFVAEKLREEEWIMDPAEQLDEWYPKRAELTIVQPNAFTEYYAQTWEIDDPHPVISKWVPKIKDMLSKVEENAGVYVLGSQCTWCDGLVNCPGVWEEAAMFSERSEKSMYKLTSQQISKLLEKKEAISKLMEKLNEIAESRIMVQGDDAIPGFKRVYMTKKYKSFKPGAEDELLEMGFDEADIWDKPKLASPAAIHAKRKQYKWKDAKKEVDALVTENPKNYFYVVPESDKRPLASEIDGNDFEEFYEGAKDTNGGDSDAWGDLLD
jgi:hypothetical protein